MYGYIRSIRLTLGRCAPCGRIFRGRAGSRHPTFNLQKFVLLGLRGIVSSHYHRIHSLGIETQHIEFRDMRLDEHVRKINILIVGVSTKHTDHLRHDITYVVHLFEARHHVGKFYGNNDIGSHGLRNICRKIVSRTAVYKDHSVRTHRFEKSRDGHGGTKGSINGSAAPVLCLAAYHIRSHTHERYRKVVERHFVLIPHGKTRYLIVDIEPVRVSRRKRTHEGLLLIFLIVLLAAVKKVGCCLERYCEDIFGVVHLG